MCSGQVLEDLVQEFCIKNNKNEGELWQIINNIHTKQYGINVMSKKHEYEKENGLGDVPMADQFARMSMVHNAVDILKGLQECIYKGYPLE
jgi:hypothetical protein